MCCSSLLSTPQILSTPIYIEEAKLSWQWHMYVNLMANPHPWTLHARRFLALPLAGETRCLLVLNSVAFLVDSPEQMLVRPLNGEEAEP